MTTGKSIYINVDSGEKTFVTPRHIVEACGLFDCDPCVPEVMPWKTATRIITAVEDGLVQPWNGRVWLNPPYGKEAKPFFEKMAEHVQNGGSGIALTFVRTDNKTWHELIFPYAKGFLFLKGHVAFCDTHGKKIANGGTMPSVLIAYTDDDVEALKRAKDMLGGSLIVGTGVVNKEINMNKILDSILLDIEESERILQSNQMVYCSDVPWRILYAEACLDVLHKYKQLIEGQNNASV